jgi:TadE-like protein
LSRRPSRCAGHVRSDRGSSVVEAVIVVPVVMVLLLVGVQFALWMHASQVVQLAASEGDRSARSIGGGPSIGIARARQVVDGPGSDVTSPSITTSALAGDVVLLRVSGAAVSILPGLSFGVSASAVGPVQQFRSSE